MTRLVAALRSEFRRVVPAGYSLSDLSTDLSAGLTVSVVALPLGLVVAIAAGASPDRGLVGIIIGGAVIALFTASRFQIGGPTEACILIAVVVIEIFGYEGLLAASLLAGLFLLAMAITRVGILIEAMPQAVITGFVTGMGLIIFTGQIVPFLGLAGSVHAHEHGGGEHSHSFLFIIEGVVSRLGNFEMATFLIGAISLLAVVLTKRYLPRLPSYVMGLAVGALATGLLKLPVATIGSTFGDLPNRLPLPMIPSLEFWVELMPYAVAIAFLSSAESLLAASMASRSRGVASRPNREFTALGLGNIATAIWGGFPVGGCVARTATCLASGARTPLAGLFHAIFVAVFVLFFSWALEFIPLTSLAAVLLVVAGRMIEVDRMRAIWRAPIGDRIILVGTLGTTLLWDLRYVLPGRPGPRGGHLHPACLRDLRGAARRCGALRLRRDGDAEAAPLRDAGGGPDVHLPGGALLRHGEQPFGPARPRRRRAAGLRLRNAERVLHRPDRLPVVAGPVPQPPPERNHLLLLGNPAGGRRGHARHRLQAGGRHLLLPRRRKRRGGRHRARRPGGREHLSS